GPEGQQARSAPRRALLLEDVLPHGIPPGAAELLRPVRPAPAAPVQDLLPADRLVPRDLRALEHLAARVGRDVRFDERPDFVAEGELRRGEVQVHRAGPPCATPFRRAKLCSMPRIRRSTAKSGLATVPDRKFVTALGRGLDVLRCFGPRDRWLANQEIAARTGLARPTVSRLVYTLTQLGFLRPAHSPRKYALGSAAVSLGYSALTQIDIRRAARPLLHALSQQ